MTLSCGTSEARLVAFADGGAADLERHVAGCEVCQAWLAERWGATESPDLVEPVMSFLTFEAYLVGALRLGAGVAGRFARAMVTYTDPNLGEEAQ